MSFKSVECYIFSFFPSFLFSIQVRMIWECRTTGCQVPCHLWITTMVSPPLCRPERTLRNGRLSAHLAAFSSLKSSKENGFLWIPMDTYPAQAKWSSEMFWAPRQQEVMVLLCHDVAGAPASHRSKQLLIYGTMELFIFGLATRACSTKASRNRTSWTKDIRNRMVISGSVEMF